MGRHLDNDTLRLWRFLVEAGDYHTVFEIRRAWFAELSPDTVRSMVLRLHANAMVAVRRQGNKHPRYGVTTVCAAPPGYEYLMQPTAAAEAAS